MEVGFYHATRDPVELVAVRLAARAIADRSRLLIVAAPERLAALDAALWTADADSFLAHGMAGSEDDALQPILLSATADPANGARLLLLAEAGLPADFERFDRVFHLFAQASEAQQRARADWKALADREGVTRSYWQQTPRGGWERKGV